MIDKIVVAVCIVLCSVAGAWVWFMENGPEKKDDKEGDHQEDQEHKNEGH